MTGAAPACLTRAHRRVSGSHQRQGVQPPGGACAVREGLLEMADFHFVEDYERLVDSLVKTHPIDEAMSIAVGGSFETTGQIELDILRHAGLRSGMSLLDMGCGSGRLAHVLGASGLDIDYVGVDIVQALLDYAATRSPAHYRYILNRTLSWPVADDSIDLACGFSLFTHLLQHETYIYLDDLRRALRAGGRVVFSFLEFAAEPHWGTFLHTVNTEIAKTPSHLNMFMERPVIELWADKLGYAVDEYIEPAQQVSSMGNLGQSVVILSLK